MKKNTRWALLIMPLSFQVNAAGMPSLVPPQPMPNEIDKVIAQQQKEFGKMAEQSKMTVEKTGVATQAIHSINDAVQKTQMLFEPAPKKEPKR